MMTPLLAFTQSTAYELTPASQRLPPMVWTAFTALNKIHGVWRWYRKAELYTKPDTFAQLIAGHLVNFVIGDVLIIRIAAQCVLISTRILECAQQQTLAYNSTRQWWVLAVQGQFPRPTRVKWNKQKYLGWFSPSTSSWFNEKICFVRNRVKRIVKYTATVFLNYFKFSMRLMDAMDTFCVSPAVHNESINEFFVNAVKCMNSLVENKEELLDGLESNQVIIEKMLWNSSITYNQLHTNVAKTIEKTKVIYEKAKVVTDFGGGLLGRLYDRMVVNIPLIVGIR